MVVSITNSKGGVGKITTLLNLGTALAKAEKRVLLIDSDPQGNLTAAPGYTPGEQQNTLAKLLLWLSTPRRTWNSTCPAASCTRRAALT